ncbi:hypothetical protein KAX75_02905 [candidate division WOR-3 bacterium]|nr:hypothetical protein [candidate division WOR-3 bacterium]
MDKYLYILIYTNKIGPDEINGWFDFGVLESLFFSSFGFRISGFLF